MHDMVACIIAVSHVQVATACMQDDNHALGYYILGCSHQ